MPDISRNEDWYDDNVESFVDGTLDASDLDAFSSMLENDPRLQRHVDTAVAIKHSLSEMTITEIPESVVSAVAERIASSNSGKVLRLSQSSTRSSFPMLRKLTYASVAAAASIILLFIVVQSEPVTPNTDNPSQAEVDAALTEVKRTLALVSEMGYERDDIVNGHVVDPVQKAMSYIFITEPDTDIQ